jgi:hypothetical protein
MKAKLNGRGDNDDDDDVDDDYDDDDDGGGGGDDYDDDEAYSMIRANCKTSIQMQNAVINNEHRV